MYLYNSATHKKEEFRTHTPGHVEMYTCGPTVIYLLKFGDFMVAFFGGIVKILETASGLNFEQIMNQSFGRSSENCADSHFLNRILRSIYGKHIKIVLIFENLLTQN